MRIDTHWKVAVKVMQGKHVDRFGPYFLNGTSYDVNAAAITLVCDQEYAGALTPERLQHIAVVQIAKIAYRD